MVYKMANGNRRVKKEEYNLSLVCWQGVHANYIWAVRRRRWKPQSPFIFLVTDIFKLWLSRALGDSIFSLFYTLIWSWLSFPSWLTEQTALLNVKGLGCLTLTVKIRNFPGSPCYSSFKTDGVSIWYVLPCLGFNGIQHGSHFHWERLETEKGHG